MNTMFLKSLNKPQLGWSLMRPTMNNYLLQSLKTPSMNTYFSRALFCSRWGHHVANNSIFGTDTPNHSNKSQKGLYHGKTHHRIYQICFSDKRHPRMQKPNVSKKVLYSDFLKRSIKLPVTAYALKNIIKTG